MVEVFEGDLLPAFGAPWPAGRFLEAVLVSRRGNTARLLGPRPPGFGSGFRPGSGLGSLLEQCFALRV